MGASPCRQEMAGILPGANQAREEAVLRRSER